MPCFQSGYKFFEYDEIDSTNLEAKRYAASNSEPLQEIPVFIAKSQTGGRGRLGRSFFSPEETGLYMSILLPINENLIETDLITPACGVAVCRTIEELSKQEPKIKWVNDIYCRGRKVVGILTEGGLKAGTDQLSYAVLGIGINLWEPTGGFPEEIKKIAGSVLTESFQPDKMEKEQLIDNFNTLNDNSNLADIQKYIAFEISKIH